MTSYVSCNRLRLRMVGGLCGRSGTATSASGYYSIVHGLGTPTIFGAFIETSAVTTTGQWTRQCKVKLSGTVIRVRVQSGASTGLSAASTTAPLRWFAAE
jgi:hypothetical protein